MGAGHMAWGWEKGAWSAGRRGRGLSVGGGAKEEEEGW